MSFLSFSRYGNLGPPEFFKVPCELFLRSVRIAPARQQGKEEVEHIRRYPWQVCPPLLELFEVFSWGTHPVLSHFCMLCSEGEREKNTCAAC